MKMRRRWLVFCRMMGLTISIMTELVLYRFRQIQRGRQGQISLSAGYPKSGFTYDMYRDNAGIMTTESDKEKYTLYELQDRLGAQIRLFEGVRDAKVTIAEAGDQKYALDDTVPNGCFCLGGSDYGKRSRID